MRNIYRVKIIVNGNWLGTTDKPHEFYLFLKQKKYEGILNIYTSIIFDYSAKELRICNDAGRPTRPLLRVKENKLLITKDIEKKIFGGTLKWDDFTLNHNVPDSIIEYLADLLITIGDFDRSLKLVETVLDEAAPRTPIHNRAEELFGRIEFTQSAS